MRKSRFIYLITVISAILFCASCSKQSSVDELFEKIPSNVDFGCVIIADEIVRSAGGELDNNVLNLPSYFSEIYNIDKKELTELQDEYGEMGIDGRKIALCANVGNETLAFILKIEDKDKLVNNLKTKGFDKFAESKYDSYIDKRNKYIFVIDGNFVYMTGGNSAGKSKRNRSFVERIIEDARLSSVASLDDAVGFMSDGNAAGMFLNKENLSELSRYRHYFAAMPLKNSDFICLNMNLRNDEMIVNVAFFDVKGKKIDINSSEYGFNVNARISKEALSYIKSSECLVYAMALKDVDWDSWMKKIKSRSSMDPMQTMVFSMIKTYLEKIDGTVVVGIGFEGGLRSMLQIGENPEFFSDIPLTVVIQTASGKDKGFVGDISAVFAATGFKVKTDAEGFSVVLPENMGTIYGKAENNTVILSTRPVKRYDDNKAVNEANMKNYGFAMALYLPSENNLMQELGIYDNLFVSAVSDVENSEGSITARITGKTEGAFVERLLKVIAAFQKGGEKIKFQEVLDDNFTTL